MIKISEIHRYGFNGMERDDNVKGAGNSYTTEFRQYDPRVGRWLTIDPLASKFPWQSPYVAYDNNPIYFKDPKGSATEKTQGDYYDTQGNWLSNDGIDDQKVYEVSQLPSFSSEVEGTPNNTVVEYLGKVKDVYVTGDAVSDTRIQNLHPAIRMKATNFIKKANEGSSNTLIRVAQGLRTFAEQDALYAKGRTTEGSIVTNAQGGHSNHNFGLAFDVVGITDGKIDYNLEWKDLSKLGKSYGFEWGGDWKSIVDKPHFQNLFGESVKSLRKKYNSDEKMSDGYVDL